MPTKLDELTRALEPLKGAERAATELRAVVPGEGLFFGLVGLEMEPETVALVDGHIVIRRVTNPPGIIHVFRAARRDTVGYLVAARYSSSVTAEVVVEPALIDRMPDGVDDLAWHTAALLRLIGASTLISPASATASWDVIAAMKDGDVVFRALDDVPRQLVGGSPRALSDTDFGWIEEHWAQALDLRGRSRSRRFGLALNLSYTWNHTTDPRAAIANLWCGLEALFGDRRDRRVTDSLENRISSWIPRTTGRDEVRALYAARCDAVHGRWLDDSPELRHAVERSEALLCATLIECIERNTAPLPDWR